ncbi:hypothetical protein MKX01_029281 [Papaver californicum]|nr:hypothetical protein MKX01_029281 [Papaver californicum]
MIHSYQCYTIVLKFLKVSLTFNTIYYFIFIHCIYCLILQADGYTNTGCFNTLCPGFVQMHPRITFGQLLEPISVYRGRQTSMLVMVYRSPENGHWWLSIGKEVIGYWPSELFTYMKHNAIDIKYGGIAGGLSEEQSPPMGNGHFPTKDSEFNNAGFMGEMKVFNETLHPAYFDFVKAVVAQDRSKDCYNMDYYYSEEHHYNYIEYGGPGGFPCNESST